MPISLIRAQAAQLKVDAVANIFRHKVIRVVFEGALRLREVTKVTSGALNCRSLSSARNKSEDSPSELLWLAITNARCSHCYNALFRRGYLGLRTSSPAMTYWKVWPAAVSLIQA